MVEVVLDNRITVTGLPKSIQDWFEALCVFNTQAFQTEDLPPTLNLFERLDNNTIRIPRGFLNYVEDFCRNSSIKLDIKYNTAKPVICNFSINPTLNYTTGTFGYQGRVVNELFNFNTVRLEAITGSGKTVLASLFIGLSNKGPTLFLVNKDRLLKQFILTIQKVLNIPEEELGIIKATKRNIKPITVGSLQTLGKEKFNLEEIKYTFYNVFFDECHISSALTYRRVLLNLAPRNLIGLSATPEHYASDDLNLLMHGLLGPIGIRVEEHEVPGRIVPKTFTRKTGFSFTYKASQESPEWLKHKCRHKMFNQIAMHSERNEKIIEDCRKAVASGNKVLITVNRVYHGFILSQLLERQGIKYSFPYKITHLDSQEKDMETKVDHKKLNEDVLEIEKGNIDVLIGTLSLFQVGFDCRALSCLLMASPFSGANTTALTQIIGRIQRHFYNKTRAFVVDYLDDSYPVNVLKQWGDSRTEFMEKNYPGHKLL